MVAYRDRWELFDTTSNRTETENIYSSERAIANTLLSGQTVWHLLVPRDPPYALPDAFQLADTSQLQALDVLANDPGNIRASSLAVYRSPSLGTLSVDSINRELIFEPHPDASGLDWFSYRVTSPDGIFSQPVPVYLWLGDRRSAETSLESIYLEVANPGQYRLILEGLPSFPGTVEMIHSLVDTDWQTVPAHGELNGNGIWFIDTLASEQPVFLRLIHDSEVFIPAVSEVH